MISKLPDLSIIIDKNPNSSFTHQHSTSVQQALGPRRYRFITLLSSLVSLNYLEMNTVILDSGVLTKIFNLFLELRFNSFLHVNFYFIIAMLLRKENNNDEFKLRLLRDLNITERLPRV